MGIHGVNSSLWLPKGDRGRGVNYTEMRIATNLSANRIPRISRCFPELWRVPVQCEYLTELHIYIYIYIKRIILYKFI